MLVLEKDAESFEQRYFIVNEDNDVISAWEYADDATGEYKELRNSGYKVKILSKAKCLSLGII